MTNAPCDLKSRARRAMLDNGFHPDFPPEILAELESSIQHPASSLLPSHQSINPSIHQSNPLDLRSLLWSSIDNDHSRDLDQVEFAEKQTDSSYRLLVGIADVDSRVAKGSAIDRHAQSETTSVYTGVTVFPMLPEALSTNATSLMDSQDRLSVVIEMRIANSGEVTRQQVYLALIRNKAKLAYTATGAWLEGRGPIPPAIAAVRGMEEQIRLQLEISSSLLHFRKEQGALTFGSMETTPVIENGVVKDVQITSHTVASDIIESFMIAANVSMARFLMQKGSLSIRRVVKTPKRWERIRAIAAPFGVQLPQTPDPRALSEFLDRRRATDPEHFPELSLSIVKLLGPGEYTVEVPGGEREGHFGLAVRDYTHSTAPNRRYADLVTQRLLKATLNGGGPAYSEPELAAIAEHCTEREDAARKVERLMRKVAAACLLSSRIGEVFDGIITGAAPKGTYVRLFKVPAEGRIVRNERGVDVGDKVKVRLISVDIPNGFIDFERISPSTVPSW